MFILAISSLLRSGTIHLPATYRVQRGRRERVNTHGRKRQHNDITLEDFLFIVV